MVKDTFSYHMNKDNRYLYRDTTEHRT